MTISDFDRVGRFHARFGLPVAGTEDERCAVTNEHPDGRDVTLPRLLDETTFAYRAGFLREELAEYEAAHRAGDLAGVADALADLVVVALGTAHYHGLPWPAIFDEVMRANERKIRGTGSKRGPAEKIVKPPGWTPPDHGPALAAARRRACWEA